MEQKKKCTINENNAEAANHIRLLTFQMNTFLSHPQVEQRHPSPSRHQSTPITNSVCCPIHPHSLPPTKGASRCPILLIVEEHTDITLLLLSKHTRHVVL